MLTRVTLKSFRNLSGIDGCVLPPDSAITGSNVYSSSESILLGWLTMHLQKVLLAVHLTPCPSATKVPLPPTNFVGGLKYVENQQNFMNGCLAVVCMLLHYSGRLAGRASIMRKVIVV